MSIQAQIDRIKSDVDSESALIQQIAGALVGKAAGGGSAGILPAGYACVPCVKFTGEQVVDTGVICNQDTKIRILFTRDNSDAQYLYGVVNSSNTASVTAYLSSSGSWRFGNKYASKNIAVSSEMVQCAIVDKTGVDLANSTGGISGVTDFETIGTLLIGACRLASGAVGAAQFVGKILSFEIWQGDALALQLVPAVNASGAYGLFDTVAGEFHESITDVPLEGGTL